MRGSQRRCGQGISRVCQGPQDRQKREDAVMRIGHDCIFVCCRVNLPTAKLRDESYLS